MLLNETPSDHVTVVFMPTVDKPWYFEADVWVAVATVALAIVTAILAYYTYRLFAAAKLARADSLDAIQAAKDGVAASEKSASAAGETAAIARETMQRTLRAYVVVKEVDPQNAKGLTMPNSVAVTIVNTGQTPSQEQYCFCEIEALQQVPTKSKFDTQVPPHDIHDVLGINQTRIVHRSTPPSTASPAQILQKSVLLVFHGLVKYKDMFTDEPHFTAFCYVWDPGYSEWVPTGPLNYVK